MTKKQKVVLKRGLRSLAAVVIAALAGWLAGPDVSGVLSSGAQGIVTGVIVPALLMLDKYLRIGAVGEDD